MRPFVSLRGRREFTLTMRRGAVAAAPALVVYAFSPRSRTPGPPKVGVVVTKKVGKAVIRNRIRRRCKAILEKALPTGRAAWWVVQCKPACASLSFAELRRQLGEATARASAPRRRQA